MGAYRHVQRTFRSPFLCGKVKMVKLIVVLSILLFAFSTSSAEWIVADPAPETDVVTVVIVQDGAEIIRPYAVTDGHVKLIDISIIAQADFEFMFENDQYRRSDPTLFTLKPKPNGCQNVRIIK